MKQSSSPLGSVLLAVSSKVTPGANYRLNSPRAATVLATVLSLAAAMPALPARAGTAGLFTRAITAQGPIFLNGGSSASGIIIDSFNSQLGAYDPGTNRTPAGSIATDSTAASAIFVNYAKVYGTADTGPRGTVEVAKGAVGDVNWCASNTGIEPGWTNADMNMAFWTNLPPSGAMIPTTVTSVSGSNITYLTVDSSVATYQASSFTSSDSSQPMIVTGHSALYLTGNLTVQGTGYIYIAPGGSLTLYVGGKTTVISGYGVVNANAAADTFRYVGLVGNTTVNCSGNSVFFGTINAPQADVNTSGTMALYGAVICSTYTASGSSSVHFDAGVSIPVITAPANLTLECPANTSTNATGVASAKGGCSALSVTYNDVLSSNCGGTKVISRLWTASDACGGSASALQTITVVDTTPPSITAPANQVLAFVSNTSTNSTGAATAHDGCSSVSVSYSDVVTAQANGSQIIARTWVATDACGNSVSALQTITLNAPLPLVLPAQPNLAIADLTTLRVTNTASDPNSATDILGYQLINPPAGASIDSNGIISWTPTVTQSPSTNIITTVVTTTVTNTSTSAIISATNSFIVTVSGPYDGVNLLTDSNGDGFTNLVGFAVGSDPSNPAGGNNEVIIFITQAGGNHYLAMKYKARINAAALQLQYLPEVSADKLAWFSDANDVLPLSVTPLDSVFNWVTVRDTTPITPAEARFIRLHVISGVMASFSPIWIGSDTLLQGNNLTLFSQRMVRPVISAGRVSALSSTLLNDTNATFATSQFGAGGMPGYVEFDSGAMMDIANTSPQSVALVSSAAGLASTGDAYRIRAHFTVASLLGTNNETGLVAGANPAAADNVLIYDPETKTTLTLFYYSNPALTSWQGWVRADTFTPDPNEVVYPEQGLMVRRIVPSDAHLYLCGPIKVGVTLAPVQPGYNLMGTLKSLSSVTLSNLNLFTGDSTTGMAGGLNSSAADNLIVVQPNGSVATYFYYHNPGVYQGWLNANGFAISDNVQIPPGSAFFINRQSPGGFTWTIPAE